MSESVVIRFTHFNYYFKLKIKKTELKLHKPDKGCKLTYPHEPKLISVSQGGIHEVHHSNNICIYIKMYFHHYYLFYLFHCGKIKY